MKITRVETYPLFHPLSEPYGDANGNKQYRTCYLIKIITEDGIEGWGECVDWLPTLDKGFKERIIPYLVGQRVSSRTLIAQQINQWNQRASAAVSMALTEIMATYAGLSICDLWGGKLRSKVPVYASFQSYTARQDWIDHSIRQIEKEVMSGFSQIKVKIGGRRVEEDLVHIEALFDRMGEQIQVAIDANQSYDFSTTKHVIKRLGDRANLLWIEEPMPLDAVLDYAQLRAWSPYPIAGGENLQGIQKFLPLLQKQGLDIAQPDVMHHAEIEQYRLTLQAARGFGIRVSPHAFDGILSRIYAIYAQACLPGWSKMENDEIEPVEWDVMENPFNQLLSIKPINGYISIPDGIGLGLQLDVEMIKKLSRTES